MGCTNHAHQWIGGYGSYRQDKCFLEVKAAPCNLQQLMQVFHLFLQDLLQVWAVISLYDNLA